MSQGGKLHRKNLILSFIYSLSVYRYIYIIYAWIKFHFYDWSRFKCHRECLLLCITVEDVTGVWYKNTQAMWGMFITRSTGSLIEGLYTHPEWAYSDSVWWCVHAPAENTAFVLTWKVGSMCPTKQPLRYTPQLPPASGVSTLGWIPLAFTRCDFTPLTADNFFPSELLTFGPSSLSPTVDFQGTRAVGHHKHATASSPGHGVSHPH